VRRSADASSIVTVSAYATPLATRSMRAATRSPGIAPPTRTTCPSEARNHPAAGRRLVDRQRQDLTRRQHSGEGDDWKAETLADEAIDGRFPSTRKRLRRHGRAEPGELGVRLAGQRLARRLVERRPRLLHELGVERRQPIDECLARVTAQARDAARAASSSRATRSITSSNASPSTPVARACVRRRIARSRCAGSDRGGRASSAPAVPSPDVDVGAELARPATSLEVKPSARRQSSKTSSTSASQKSIFTGRRRPPLRW